MSGLGFSDLSAQVRHGLTRLDVREALPQMAPLRRRVAPALAVGLGGSLLISNWRRAADDSKRNKALLRDVVVLSGTTLGLLAGWRFTRTRWARQLAEALSRLVRSGETGSALRATALDRVTNLLEPPLRSRGAEGFVKLESLAVGAIVGGGLSGLLADALNGEDWRQTGPAKLKEGVFQWVGNITFCAISILAMSAGGKAVAGMLSRNPAFQVRARQALARRLQSLQNKPADTLARVPVSLTESVERLLLAPLGVKERQQKLRDILAHELPQVAPAVQEQVVTGLAQALGKSQPEVVHRAVRRLASGALGRDIAEVAARQQGFMAGDFDRLSRRVIESRGRMLGTAVGLGAGVLGGAWVSNQVNTALSQRMGWAQGRSKVQLFGPPSPGLLQGRLGERGVHWWDALLHLDDWPSALYLAGMKSLESVISIFYAISGYLTGMAGVDYSEPTPTPLKHSALALRPGESLRRPRGYVRFERSGTVP